MIISKYFNQYLSIFLIFAISICVNATTYQEPVAYINAVFSGDVPKVSKIWIGKDLKVKIRKIMKHDLGLLRLKYWENNGRTAWILEEIGKERLITAGIVVNDNKIESVKVLSFRESRGWEVRYPFFTDQFNNVSLKENHVLNKYIDGISGATLSVNAMKKMVRLALLLHQETKSSDK